MRIIAFLIFSLFIQVCFAGENCNNPETQYEMNICSGTKLTSVENKLKQKEMYIQNYLKKINGEKIFLKSNEAWLNYRDLHCESTSKIYESGSIHNLIVSECKIILTKDRLDSLNKDYQDTINTITKGEP